MPVKPAALVVETVEQRDPFLLQPIDLVARIDREMHERGLLLPGRVQE